MKYGRKRRKRGIRKCTNISNKRYLYFMRNKKSSHNSIRNILKSVKRLKEMLYT
jgi:hypothetical protein